MVRYADKIAYMNHDIDDAIRAGVLKGEDLPRKIRGELGLTRSERISAFVDAVIENSGEDIRMDEYHQGLYDELRSFLFEAVYTNPVAKAEEGKAKRVVGAMYEYFVGRPGEMPAEYRDIAEAQDIHRAVCDYISGMSDRYCVSMYEKLFVPKYWPVGAIHESPEIKPVGTRYIVSATHNQRFYLSRTPYMASLHAGDS